MELRRWSGYTPEQCRRFVGLAQKQWLLLPPAERRSLASAISRVLPELEVIDILNDKLVEDDNPAVVEILEDEIQRAKARLEDKDSK